MSGRQAKLQRREIRRAAEAGLRMMQEQQEHAITDAIERCNLLTIQNQILTAHLATLEKRIAALEPGAHHVKVVPFGSADSDINAIKAEAAHRSTPDAHLGAVEPVSV